VGNRSVLPTDELVIADEIIHANALGWLGIPTAGSVLGHAGSPAEFGATEEFVSDVGQGSTYQPTRLKDEFGDFGFRLSLPPELPTDTLDSREAHQGGQTAKLGWYQVEGDINEFGGKRFIVGHHLHLPINNFDAAVGARDDFFDAILVSAEPVLEVLIVGAGSSAGKEVGDLFVDDFAMQFGKFSDILVNRFPAFSGMYSGNEGFEQWKIRFLLHVMNTLPMVRLLVN
jgi:hypothetical protein